MITVTLCADCSEVHYQGYSDTLPDQQQDRIHKNLTRLIGCYGIIPEVPAQENLSDIGVCDCCNYNNFGDFYTYQLEETT